MYNKILVTLDGSQLAECSLEHVKTIAIGCNVPQVIVLRVLEPVKGESLYGEAYGDVLVQAEAQLTTEAQIYLVKLKDRLRKEELSVQTALVPGRDVAETILEYARDNSIDLIIMSTHGRSGPSRWAFGSVAERVLRHSPIPVLVISPSTCRTS